MLTAEYLENIAKYKIENPKHSQYFCEFLSSFLLCARRNVCDYNVLINNVFNLPWYLQLQMMHLNWCRNIAHLGTNSNYRCDILIAIAVYQNTPGISFASPTWTPWLIGPCDLVKHCPIEKIFESSDISWPPFINITSIALLKGNCFLKKWSTSFSPPLPCYPVRGAL